MDMLSKLKLIEEAYFKQKSRVNWLGTGYQNTAYFQNVAKARNDYNFMHSLIGFDGYEATTPSDMGALAANHFQSILGPPLLSRGESQSNLPLLSSILASTCPLEAMSLLSRYPTAEEITKTMFKRNPNKSPSPDGLISDFYKAGWSVMGDEVIRPISRCFYNPFMPLATNSNILTLVPKELLLSRTKDQSHAATPCIK